MAFPREIPSKIFSANDLARELAKKFYRSKRVVFTNGCFDILHKGHIRYLDRARRLGDFFVVALNTDASVKKLKGPKRPINRLSDRLEVIASLECVDFVTWFGEETPLKLIKKLHPQILVKGGDWKVDQIVGGREVFDWGGKVVSVPFVKGRSSTSVIEKLGL